MGNYEQLKQAVSDVIKKNGNQEITGAIMQNTLLTIISTVGNNATFAGIATPETNPGTPDANIFYLAAEPGIYANFGGVELTDQVLIFTNKNGNWVKQNSGITTKVKVEELENDIYNISYQNVYGINVPFGSINTISTESENPIYANNVGRGSTIYGIRIKTSQATLNIPIYKMDIVNKTISDVITSIKSKGGIETILFEQPIELSSNELLAINVTNFFFTYKPTGCGFHHWYSEDNRIVFGANLVLSYELVLSARNEYQKNIDNFNVFKENAVTTIYSDELVADLSIEDSAGNVLCEFANGHIRTKKFDSSNIPSGGGGGSYLPRPTDGVVNFTVPVDTYIADISSDTNELQDESPNQIEEYVKEDNGILILPENYSQSGKPTRMIICCHGTGTWITNTSNQIANGYMFFLTQGYAIMDINGVPGSTPTSARHYGTPVILRSLIAAYNFCIQNYNIYSDVFVSGLSMGGLASTIISESGAIPVIAQGAFCPCIDIYREAFATAWNGAQQRQEICEKFGFTGTPPSNFTNTRPVPEDEQNYFLANIDKVIGYNCMWKNTIGLNFENCVSVPVPNNVLTETEDEKNLFSTANKIRRIPIKIWHCTNDTTIPYKYSKYYIDMCRRSGCLAELRPFPTGGHAAWAGGGTVTDIPTITEETTSCAGAIWELYRWFKRFE